MTIKKPMKAAAPAADTAATAAGVGASQQHQNRKAQKTAQRRESKAQAEAAAAMMQAFELSGDRAFLDRFLELGRFIRTELRDPLYHEYFAYAPIAGKNYLDYKGSEFKGFFHLPRFFLTVIETIDRMLEDRK